MFWVERNPLYGSLTQSLRRTNSWTVPLFAIIIVNKMLKKIKCNCKALVLRHALFNHHRAEIIRTKTKQKACSIEPVKWNGGNR